MITTSNIKLKYRATWSARVTSLYGFSEHANKLDAIKYVRAEARHNLPYGGRVDWRVINVITCHVVAKGWIDDSGHSVIINFPYKD